MNREIEASLIKYIADEWRSLRSDESATARDSYSSRAREAHEAALKGHWNTSPQKRWP